jgi:hypothetical protein
MVFGSNLSLIAANPEIILLISPMSCSSEDFTLSNSDTINGASVVAFAETLLLELLSLGKNDWALSLN